DGDRHDEDLQDVEAEVDGAVVAGRALDPEHVRGHESGEEVEPAAGALRLRGGIGADLGALRGIEEQGEADADADGDEGGRGEPEEGLPREPGRAGDLLEVGD